MFFLHDSPEEAGAPLHAVGTLAHQTHGIMYDGFYDCVAYPASCESRSIPIPHRSTALCTSLRPSSCTFTVVLQLIIVLDRIGRYTETTGGLHPLQTRRHLAAVRVLLRGIPWCVPDLPWCALRSSRQISLACDLCGPWKMIKQNSTCKALCSSNMHAINC